MTSNFLILNYHGIESKPGEYSWHDVEMPYVLSSAQFEQQLDAILHQGIKTLRVRDLSDWRVGNLPGAKICMLTFDDGHVSNLQNAAKLLHKRNLNALFFISAGLIGEKPLMSRIQIKELYQIGFEIGSHGYHHRPYTNLSDKEIRFQLEESKKVLEDITASPITSFSIPRGFYQPRIAQIAAAVGYQYLFTSQYGINQNEKMPYFKRVAIKNNVTLNRFHEILSCRLGFKQYVEDIKSFTREHMSPTLYDHLVRLKLRASKKQIAKEIP